MKETNKLVKLLKNFSKESLQDKLIDKSEYDSSCNVFTRYVDEMEK